MHFLKLNRKTYRPLGEGKGEWRRNRERFGGGEKYQNKSLRANSRGVAHALYRHFITRRVHSSFT